MQQAQHELLDPTIPFQDKAAKMVQHLDVMHERTRYINSITLETEQSRLEAQQGCLAAQERQLQLWQAAVIAAILGKEGAEAADVAEAAACVGCGGSSGEGLEACVAVCLLSQGLQCTTAAVP
jgi:hypothetical protein